MDFAIPEETKMMQTLMRDFVNKEVLPIEQELLRTHPDWHMPPKEIFDKLRNRVKELGLWALDVPKEFGGAGLDTVTLCLLNEEQSRTLLGCGHTTPFWEEPSAIFPALYRGSDYQKENYLYPLVKGDKIKAMAHTEPDAGSDAAAIKTTAVKDGNDWIINGTKRFSSMADACDFCLVTAYTDKSKGRHGITVFIVNRDNPGFHVTPWYVIRPEYTTEVVLEDCRVPDKDRLEGSGWDILMEGLNDSRMMIGTECLGRARRALEIATEYAQSRVTFGQPLAQRQFIQGYLIESAMDIRMTRLLALDAAWKIDHGIPATQETSMLKVFASEMGYRVVDRAVQILGGVGISKELPLERMLREMRVRRIVDGGTEVLLWIMARELLKGWQP